MLRGPVPPTEAAGDIVGGTKRADTAETARYSDARALNLR